MSWVIRSNQLAIGNLLNEESLFFTGNGYIGVRGNFEEQYGDGVSSIRGTYINAFHDITNIEYGEKLFAFPDTQQKLVNVIDAQTVHIYFGEGKEEEQFSLFEGEVLHYERQFHMDKGYSERVVHWRSPKGKVVKLQFKRLSSFVNKELFLQEIVIEPVTFFGKMKVVSCLNGDVSNFEDPNDPRIGSGHVKLLSVTNTAKEGNVVSVEARTKRSNLRVACASACKIDLDYQEEIVKRENAMETVLVCELKSKAIVTKTNVYTDTLRHGVNPMETGFTIFRQHSNLTFQEAAEQQRGYLDRFWLYADVEIAGDQAIKEGIRFNLFQLLQSAGRDNYSNIAAKGLSGEGYEGHYFWDTEIYMIPVFLMTNPELAKQLLKYRYSILDHARKRARDMGHRKGALFPWRTISGEECSSFFPAGTAQYHISADIAYSYIQYYLVTQDMEFLKECGVELLVETARLWIDTGHYHEGKFKIDTVTGPDEYTAIVNNNYYTNVMAKENMRWAAKSVALLQEHAPDTLAALQMKLDLEEAEIVEWVRASEAMYLPYDSKLGINPQDDSFLQKQVWDFENTPDEHYPLLLNYHPLTLYRYQVCKQADTVLAHFLLEDEQELSVIRDSYHYYEKITTHDSSLSSCVFSIMAAKIGEVNKAYDYFIETARLDLDNTHGNTKDGLHLANMGGTWMAIVYGFAGLRIKESGLSLEPALPKQWQSLRFSIGYLGRYLSVSISSNGTEVKLLQGEPLTILLAGQEYLVSKSEIPLQQCY
ncbi:glycoside hydrolase family 65 protein [Paenibacillus sp. IHBB 10380]|uniref:glycoside hydrolase family 65 protein n=1 Tax=Paenibacillus sp. IHBB 10380 TaxID=1566358 RepID=UPI0005CFA202|nr:glycosyl hydrolase family 65 protein [Paenibacillus sp. IHBB 10380]AJS58157.1 glycoside hydrolase family 65 [Paenibacillus sp. IHBB 10380]